MLELLLILASGFSHLDAIPSKGAAINRSVFGIELGAELSLPQCKTKALTRTYISYETNYGQPLKDCWRHESINPKPGSPLPATGSVEVALSDMPTGFQWDGLELTIVEGRVEAVSIMTRGIHGQDAVLEALVAKYGEPSDRDDVPLQNRMGASFTRKSALWHFDDLLVVFVGLGTMVDNGSVGFTTPRGHAYEEAKRTTERASRRQL